MLQSEEFVYKSAEEKLMKLGRPMNYCYMITYNRNIFELSKNLLLPWGFKKVNTTRIY